MRVSFIFLATAAAALAQTSITTAQYENARTGANLRETILTPRNVNPAHFGKLFAIPVDGDVYTQPLYIPNLEIPGKGAHNTVFIATEHDSVYAFDAAGQPSQPLWRVSFINPAQGVNPVPTQVARCSLIASEVGITPTPVIDSATGAIYVLARTMERGRDGHDRLYQRLHALDIHTGAERPGSPALIAASLKTPALFGLLSREVTFNALTENPRAALLLSNGNVYIAWGSSCDVGPYFGWVLAYNARTLKQTGVFNTAPDSEESGIWQSDAGIAADSQGNVYAVTGNGAFNASAPNGRDYGDSILKLGFHNGALTVRDYFTPFNQAALNGSDSDLGSGGPVLLPDQPGPHPRLLVTAGKEGVIYLIDRDHMGKFHAGSDAHAIQTIKAGTGFFGASAWWNGHLYHFARNDVLKDFAFEGGQFAPTPVHQGAYQSGHPGAIPSISANGTRDGIVWVVIAKGPGAQGESNTFAVLQAYDAADVSRQLYSSDAEITRDAAGLSLRFTIPAVADGRVYFGTRGALSVYGLLSSHPEDSRTGELRRHPRL